jgi:hypothetical protein
MFNEDIDRLGLLRDSLVLLVSRKLWSALGLANYLLQELVAKPRCCLVAMKTLVRLHVNGGKFRLCHTEVHFLATLRRGCDTARAFYFCTTHWTLRRVNNNVDRPAAAIHSASRSCTPAPLGLAAKICLAAKDHPTTTRSIVTILAISQAQDCRHGWQDERRWSTRPQCQRSA